MKPVTAASVEIWGETAGYVAWENGETCATFEYEPKFLKKGLDLAPLTMSLRDAREGARWAFPNLDRITFHGLPGLLASSLPDLFGNKIIDSWLTRHGRDPNTFSAIERLCYIGKRGMGALEFKPQLSSKQLDKSISIDVKELMILAQEALSQRTNLDVRIDENTEEKKKAEALLAILRVGTSAGGAVPKAIIALNDQGNIISGQSDIPDDYDHWILKFDGISENKPDHFGRSFDNGRVEYAYYLMAQHAGIHMMECRLLEENGRAHFMTKRFDRVGNEKIHVLPLACMSHLGWNPVGSVGYEQAFYTMRMLRMPYPQQEQQFRRMVFNAVSRNIDDHTKNISYIMDNKGEWKLSPAYDVTFSFDSTELFGNHHKMTINGKQKDITDNDLLIVAENMEIKKAKEIIQQVRDSVALWDTFAQRAGVNNNIRKYISDLHIKY